MGYGDFQGIKSDNFEMQINNEMDSNSCVWEFYSGKLGYNEEYTGQDLKALKKMFNDMIRVMMKKAIGEI